MFRSSKAMGVAIVLATSWRDELFFGVRVQLYQACDKFTSKKQKH